MKIQRFFGFLLFLACVASLGALIFYLWEKKEKQHIANRFLYEQVQTLNEENKKSKDRNEAKRDEIEALNTKEAFALYEEHARREYGMVASRETFFPLKKSDYRHLPDIPFLQEIEKDTASLVNTGEVLPRYESDVFLNSQVDVVHEEEAPVIWIELQSLSQE